MRARSVVCSCCSGATNAVGEKVHSPFIRPRHRSVTSSRRSALVAVIRGMRRDPAISRGISIHRCSRSRDVGTTGARLARIAANTKADNCIPSPDLSPATNSLDLQSTYLQPWTEKPLAGQRRKSRSTLFGGGARARLVSSEAAERFSRKRRTEPRRTRLSTSRSLREIEKTKTRTLVMCHARVFLPETSRATSLARFLPAMPRFQAVRDFSRASVTFHGHYYSRHTISAICRRRQFSRNTSNFINRF